MSRVVVVGAGVGGLAAAARLARLRHDVVVVEQASVVGGRWRPLEHDGFRFDPVAADVRLPAVLRDFFLKTGRRLEDITILETVDTIATHVFPDGATIRLPGTGADWERLVATGRKVWEAGRTPLLEAPLSSRELRSWSLRHPSAAWLLSPRHDLRSLLRPVRDVHVRALADHLAAVAGWPAGPVPATVVALPYVEQAFRVWAVADGLGRLVEAVHERALSRGAVVVTGVRAVAVTTGAGGVTGVRLEDGRTLPADVVVSDVGPRVLYGELLPEPARTRRLRPAVSTDVLLGLRGRTTDAATRTVWHGSPSLDVRVDPAAAPPGHEAAVVSLPPGVPVATADDALSLLADRGLDLRDRVVVAAVRPVAGDVAEPQLLPGCGPETGVPGLFTVGRSPAFGRDLSFVAASAAAVAERVGRA